MLSGKRSWVAASRVIPAGDHLGNSETAKGSRGWWGLGRGKVNGWSPGC